MEITLTEREIAKVQQALYVAMCVGVQYTSAYNLLAIKVMQAKELDEVQASAKRMITRHSKSLDKLGR